MYSHCHNANMETPSFVISQYCHNVNISSSHQDLNCCQDLIRPKDPSNVM